MIVWIDGPYGIGKSATAEAVTKLLPISCTECLDSDEYYDEYYQKMDPMLKLGGGAFPQNNQNFIQYFRNIIEEKATDKDKVIVVEMALTMRECKEGLFDYLISRGEEILHIILLAEEETLLSRIENDSKERDKAYAMRTAKRNIDFLDKEYNDAVKIKTDGTNISDIAQKIC